MIELAAMIAACTSVPVATFAPVLMVESQLNPLAINVNSPQGPRSIIPKTLEEAVAIATQLKSSNASFDAGIAQLNSANWKVAGITVETVFDPCTNLQAAAKILEDCFLRAPADGDEQQRLRAGLSCYNTGNFTGGLRTYVPKIERKARQIVPALDPRFNAATPKAQQEQDRISTVSTISKGDQHEGE